MAICIFALCIASCISIGHCIDMLYQQLFVQIMRCSRQAHQGANCIMLGQSDDAWKLVVWSLSDGA